MLDTFGAFLCDQLCSKCFICIFSLKPQISLNCMYYHPMFKEHKEHKKGGRKWYMKQEHRHDSWPVPLTLSLMGLCHGLADSYSHSNLHTSLRNPGLRAQHLLWQEKKQAPLEQSHGNHAVATLTYLIAYISSCWHRSEE